MLEHLSWGAGVQLVCRFCVVETPVRPDAITPILLGKTLSQMRALWIEDVGPGQKAQDDNKLYVGYFIGLNGDKPMRSITFNDIKVFRDLLKKRPRNLTKKVKHLSLKEQVAWGADNNIDRFLKPQTINPNGLAALAL